MLNINKDKYYNQVNNLNIEVMNLDMNDFDILYRAASGELEDNIDFDYIRTTVNKILRGIFSINISLSELLVPLNFLDTEIGKAILKVRFGISAGVYIAADLAKLTGYSVQYITAEAKRENIKGEQRGVTWLFSADEVEKYMIKKGLWQTKIYYPEPEEKFIGGYDREAEYIVNKSTDNNFKE